MGSESGTSRAVEQGYRAGLWTRAAEQGGEGHMQGCGAGLCEAGLCGAGLCGAGLRCRVVEQHAWSRAVEEGQARGAGS